MRRRGDVVGGAQSDQQPGPAPDGSHHGGRHHPALHRAVDGAVGRHRAHPARGTAGALHHPPELHVSLIRSLFNFI